MRHTRAWLIAAALVLAACGDSPTKAELGPQFVGSYAFDVQASPLCSSFPAGLPVAHFRWRIDAVKGSADGAFTLPPADDLQGLDALRLVLHPVGTSVAGQVSGTVRLEREYTSGYVVGFTIGNRSGTLTGRLQTAPDGRAEVVEGTLSGPIEVHWHSTFPDAGRICESVQHTWSLQPL